ncbi:MAG TPA: NADH-quinone oxidoreductase subunit L, partial [Candidatus Binatia bacterium]|nr:NADH-quinone oxidoreductase subunit L [Candidatus Binatia bacterium]
MLDELKPENVAWIILLLPLLAACAITLFTQRDGKVSAQLSITAVVLSLLLSCGVFVLFKDAPPVPATPLSWLPLGDLQVELGLRLDPLSLLMLLVVTFVGSAIHIYSYG